MSRLKYSPSKLLGPNLFPLVFFLFFGVIIVGGRYLPPDYQTPLVFGGFTAIIAVFAINQAIMKYIPLSFLHFDAVFYDLEGRPGKIQQVFLPANSDNLTVEHYDAAGLFRVKGADGVEKEPEELKGVKFFMLRPRLPVAEIGPYPEVKEFLIESAKTFEDSFNFGPRKKVAEYADSEIRVDHSFSDHADFDLLPWTLTKMGEEIPIVRLINAGSAWHTRRKVDQGTMNSLAGLSGLEGAYVVKCRELVRSERKVNVLAGEVKGLEDTAKDVEESAVDLVDTWMRRHTSIENAYKWVHRTQDQTLLIVIALFGMLMALAYFNSNPNAWAWAQYYAGQYWWLILLMILGVIGYFFWYRRRRRA